MENDVLSKWNELKELVESLELDVTKNAKGVVAAGVRARKGLRSLQGKSKELVKLTIELEKAAKAASVPQEVVKEEVSDKKKKTKK